MQLDSHDDFHEDEGKMSRKGFKLFYISSCQHLLPDMKHFLKSQQLRFCLSGSSWLTWRAASRHQRTAPAVPWAPPTRPCTAPTRWSLDQSDRWRCGGWCCGQAAWGWGAAAAGRSGPYLQKETNQRVLSENSRSLKSACEGSASDNTKEYTQSPSYAGIFVSLRTLILAFMIPSALKSSLKLHHRCNLKQRKEKILIKTKYVLIFLVRFWVRIV